jgi:hypothetical protein
MCAEDRVHRGIVVFIDCVVDGRQKRCIRFWHVAHLKREGNVKVWTVTSVFPCFPLWWGKAETEALRAIVGESQSHELQKSDVYHPDVHKKARLVQAFTRKLLQVSRHK